MSVVEETAALANLLQRGTGVQVYTEPDAAVNPPAIMIGPPELSWTVFNGEGPDQAKWLLYLIVSANGQSLAALEPLLTKVAAVLAGTPGAPTITDSALPGSWKASGAELPAYLVTLEGNV